MSYTLHNDQPTLVDKLAREVLVKQIAELAATCSTPQVLAVHGEWGAGKTSVLEQVQYRLTGENRRSERASLTKGTTYKHVITIWFDAWRYQNEPVPVVALLQEMRRQLGMHLKLIAQARKLTEVTVRSILSGLDNMAKLIKIEATPFSPEKIQAAGEKWEKEHLEDRLASDSVQGFLTDTIKSLLPKTTTGSPDPRLIIIIDDIDRCNADAAYRLLEGLKNYLILPNCVFILGMNQQIVTDAIGKIIGKNGNDGDVRLRAEAYLEKMCSNIWRLPFIKCPSKVLNEWFSSETKKVGDSIIAEEAKLSISFLPPNPRRLKSLANLINRICKKQNPATVNNAEHHLKILVVAYIYQFNSDLFQRWHYDPNFLSVITEWVNTDSFKETEFYFQGLILPTKLKSADQDVTPVMECEGAYPDPTAPGIFWIAPLLQKSLSHLTPTDYIDLLRFEDTP